MTSTAQSTSTKVKAKPDGYASVTAYLYLNDAAAAIEFYKQAFGAQERFRMAGPGGRIGHAEVQIGDSVVMLADEAPDMGVRSAKTIGASPIGIMLYVDDVDAVIKKSVELGGKITHQIENKFYGDRMGAFEDPFGFSWHVATHIEDVSPEEMEKRAKSQHGGNCC